MTGARALAVEAEAAPAVRARRRGVLNPYVQVAVGAVLVTASELLLKKGASDVSGASWLGVDALASAWTWGGIVTYVLSFVSWLYVLRHLPLGVAFALINAVHVLVPLASWAFLHEAVSGRRWTGIGLVLAGIVMIAGNVATAEERL
jgi:multidrug transporter EmrE-like cation transporter